MTNVSVIELIISVIITFLSYCTIPIILRLAKGKMEYNKGHKIILINCAIVWLIFQIIKISFDNYSKGAAVVLYYCINIAILLEPKNKFKENVEDNTEININEITNKNIYLSNETKKGKKNPNLTYGEDIKLEQTSDTFSINTHKEINNTKILNVLNEQNNDININNKNDKFIAIISILIIILIILSTYTYGTINSYKNKIKKTNVQIKELKTKNSILEDEINSLEKYTAKYEKYKEKSDFYDNNIVFVIDGYGKYYYTYDQMMKVTQGLDEYGYWAYNKDQAIDLGYKKWK